MLRPRSDFPDGADARALADDLRRLGLPLGAVVLVHTALRALGPVVGGAETLLEALQTVIGESGTIMVPALTSALVLAIIPTAKICQKAIPKTAKIG